MSIFGCVIAGIALVVVKFTVDNALSVRRTLSSAGIKDCPGREVLWITPFGAICMALNTTFPRSGMVGYWAAKFSLYEKFRATSYATVTFSGARQVFWIADSEALKRVCSDRHTFQKNVAAYELINVYGKNLVSLEGPEWKRHRSIAMSAFNEANVALVWSETLHISDEWLAQIDAFGSDNTVDLLHSMTQVTLFAIIAAAFGRRMSWTAKSVTELPSDCTLTFQSAVINSMKNIIFKAVTPSWFLRLSSLINVPHLSSRALLTQLAFHDLQIHMIDLVSSARADIISGERSSSSGAALLRNLVEANLNEDADAKRLTEGELLSNIFTFLLAGHETSSHTLCFAFMLLALYPDCQQKLYEEVTRVWPADVPATHLMTNHKEYMDKLEYTIACIRETLRMFPATPCLGKDVHTDTILPGTYFTPGSKDSPSAETGKFTMAIPAGSVIVIDVWGIHMNTLYWGEDVAEFKPERFIDTESYQWPRNAFLPFMLGARSCLGQRFAYAEMIGILASVIRRYQILVPDDFANKPFEEQKELLLKNTPGITLTPLNAHVKFSRRV